MDFNNKLSSIVSNCIDLEYKEFGKYINVVVKEVAIEGVGKNNR